MKIFNTIVHVLYIIFIHDTSLYIYITYINAHIHQGFNPKLHGDAPRSSAPNHLKSLISEKESLILLSSTWNYSKNSNFHILFFSIFFQMLQMKTWSWNLFNNLFMKIIMNIHNASYRKSVWVLLKILFVSNFQCWWMC